MRWGNMEVLMSSSASAFAFIFALAVLVLWLLVTQWVFFRPKVRIGVAVVLAAAAMVFLIVWALMTDGTFSLKKGKEDASPQVNAESISPLSDTVPVLQMPAVDTASKDTVQTPAKRRLPPNPESAIRNTAERAPAADTIWWRRWRAEPYDSSFAGVCQNMTHTINGFRRMPAKVKQEFMLMLDKNCAGGEEIYITPNMMFWEMWTGGVNPYPMQNVAVAKVPVSHSPEGRALREVFQTARGRKWTVEHEGRTYTLVIPYVCYNVAYMVSESDCVTVAFNAPVSGTVSFGVASVNGPLPASSCYAVKQGGGDWAAPYGECPSCLPPMSYLRQVLGDEVVVHHRYRYQVTDQQQLVRFPRAVWQKGVYFCLETSLGMTSCGMYLLPGSSPTAWAGRYFVRIDDASWQWSACPE